MTFTNNGFKANLKSRRHRKNLE